MTTEKLSQMTDKKLIKYIITHREQPEAVEARRIYISRMAEKAEKKGIQFYRPMSRSITKINDDC